MLLVTSTFCVTFKLVTKPLLEHYNSSAVSFVLFFWKQILQFEAQCIKDAINTMQCIITKELLQGAVVALTAEEF